MVDNSKIEAWKAIRSVLVVQALVSAAIAVFLIVGTVLIAANAKSGEVQADFIEILKNWGGVIIGFYFGTAYTQIATLVRAIESSPEPSGTTPQPSGTTPQPSGTTPQPSGTTPSA